MKMMNFVLKMMNFVLKMMNFDRQVLCLPHVLPGATLYSLPWATVYRNERLWARRPPNRIVEEKKSQVVTSDQGSRHTIEVSKDEFCTKNKENCIKNEEFCIKNDGVAGYERHGAPNERQ